MSKELDEINRQLGILIGHSEATNRNLDALNSKVDEHIGKEGLVYSHIDKKVRHAENRVKLLTDSIKSDIDKAEIRCAPVNITTNLEKQMNAIWVLVGLLTIGSITYTVTDAFGLRSNSKDKETTIQTTAVLPNNRSLEETDD